MCIDLEKLFVNNSHTHTHVHTCFTRFALLGRYLKKHLLRMDGHLKANKLQKGVTIGS